jgi:agmatinase
LTKILDLLDSIFITPERTKAGCSFGDIDMQISFNEADIVFFGIPLELTTSFGKGTSRGPEAIRSASGRQIETYVYDERKDIKEIAKIFDLGDIRMPENTGDNKKIESVFSYLNENVPPLVEELSRTKKKPFILGGEHTISYFCFKGLSTTQPLMIHFDAHRDLKAEYEGLKLCHTTPFYKLIDDGYIQGKNIIQIGIRQADKEENRFAEKNGIVTFDPWEIKNNIENVAEYLNKVTNNRNIYISFDIDVYDLPYVPCTGTPEPFGLDPFEILKIIKSINDSANLVGMDLVEVSLKNEDYREGALATQTLLRIIPRKYVLIDR